MNNKLLFGILAVFVLVAGGIAYFNFQKDGTVPLESSVSSETQTEYTFSFSANPASVASGEPSVLSWDAPSGSVCELKQGSLNGNYKGVANSLEAKGTYTVHPTSSDVYSLLCLPAGGSIPDARVKEVYVSIEEVQLKALPNEGSSPLSVSLEGVIHVSLNEKGSAIIFFGDGASDVMFRKAPELYEESWTHVYKNPGTYEVVLVKTTESNVDADINVMKNPLHPKNTVVAKTVIVVR